MKVRALETTPKVDGTYRVPARKILPALGSAIRDLLVQMGVFRAPKDRGAAALGVALGEIAEILEAEAANDNGQEVLLRALPISRTLTHRKRELPYTLPAEMTVGTPNTPVDLGALDPSKVYLWVLDADDRFLVAPEIQNDGTKVNHGDMCPADGGVARGAARAGGELKATPNAGGHQWSIDMSSSFSFNRMDLDVLGDDHLRTTVAYLKSTGMDTTNLTPARNTFDAIYRFGAFLYVAKYYAGTGAPR